MLEARTISVSIACPYERAYAYAREPEHFRDWAAGLAETLERDGDDWSAETPEGRATVRFSAPNPHGVLDHRVTLPDRPEIFIPLRMIPNGDGTEVIFTLFRQPGMDDAAWDRDEALVRRDLAALKAKLET